MFLEIDFDKIVERLERFIDDVIVYNLPWFLFVCLSLLRSIYHPRGHAHLSAFVAPESECSMFVLIIYEVDFSCFEFSKIWMWK